MCVRLGRKDRHLCSLPDPAWIPEKPRAQALPIQSFLAFYRAPGSEVDNSCISVSSLDSSPEIYIHIYQTACLTSI